MLDSQTNKLLRINSQRWLLCSKKTHKGSSADTGEKDLYGGEAVILFFPFPIDISLALCLGLMMGSLVETILITNLCNSAHPCPVPRWIRVPFLQILGRLFGLRPEPGAVIHRHRESEKHQFLQLGAATFIFCPFLVFIHCSANSHFCCEGKQWPGVTTGGTAGSWRRPAGAEITEPGAERSVAPG